MQKHLLSYWALEGRVPFHVDSNHCGFCQGYRSTLLFVINCQNQLVEIYRNLFYLHLPSCFQRIGSNKLEYTVIDRTRVWDIGMISELLSSNSQYVRTKVGFFFSRHLRQPHTKCDPLLRNVVRKKTVKDIWGIFRKIQKWE